MVEGADCALYGAALRSGVDGGQTVLRVTHRAGGQACNQSNGQKVSNRSDISLLQGKVYTDVETLGKELFLYFGPTALRIHFGMNGSMRINPSEKTNRSGAAAGLEIQLSNDLICFFDSTVEIRSALECKRKVKLMEELDICSPKFSFSRAENELGQHCTRMLCDVLLDQTVLPGVGNIIKNESLFDSGFHPAVKICQLSAEQIHHIVKMTRDFTILFYKCRKTGSALYKHYKVYKRSTCGQCKGQITVCRLGENSRMTYFCSFCQKEDLSQVDISSLPRRNSLLGWVSSTGSYSADNIAKKEEEEWTCALCTLVNMASVKSCEACLSPRPVTFTQKAPHQTSGFNNDLIKYPCNGFGKPQVELKLNRKTVFGTTTLVLSSLNGNVTSPANPNSTFSAFGKLKSNKPSFITLFPLHRVSCTNINDGTDALNPKIPYCTKHFRSCSLRVVKKEGANKGRCFYACSLPQGIQCDFFQWTDLDFPFCNHGKRCIMRTVLKLGPNNGRNFYVCSEGMNKQCNFFKWV
uniref:Endonuclease 8-like 3 n=1 Tax=Callorhinchus milii TaxID=7868 RepID=A0A4W3GNC8_CALMI